MFEGSEKGPDETQEGQTSGMSEDDPAGGISGQGGEGDEQANTTPDISVEGEHGQTQVDASDEEGAAPDEAEDRNT